MPCPFGKSSGLAHHNKEPMMHQHASGERKRPLSDTIVGSVLVFVAGAMVDYAKDLEHNERLDKLSHKTVPYSLP